MRASVIQEKIQGGLPPFALCRIVSKQIRAQHKRGDQMKDLISAAFKSLSHPPLQPPLQAATSRAWTGSDL